MQNVSGIVNSNCAEKMRNNMEGLFAFLPNISIVSRGFVPFWNHWWFCIFTFFIYNLFPNGNKSGLAASALYLACYNKLWWLHTISFILRNGSICIQLSGEWQALCNECSETVHIPGERWHSAHVWPLHLLQHTVKHLQLTCNIQYHVSAAWILVILCYLGMVTWEACAWSLQGHSWRP